ncbi:hypothetical protein VTO73DRAFT_12416 [Trametes versicolor]
MSMVLPNAAEATPARACVESLVPLVDALGLSKADDFQIESNPPTNDLTTVMKAVGTFVSSGEDHPTPPTFILDLTPGGDDTSSVKCDDSTLSPSSKTPVEVEEALQPQPQSAITSDEVENTSPEPGCPPGLQSEDATVAVHPSLEPGNELHPAPEEPLETATSTPEDKATTTAEAHTFEEDPARYSLEGIDPFEDFIPTALLPDELIVHDLDDISGICKRGSLPRAPAKYVRHYPKRRAGSDAPARIAHLYLSKNNRIGSGHHGAVFAAPMRLHLDPDSQEQSTIRIAAKTAFGTCGAHEMLRREAEMYDTFPRSLMEGTPVEVEATAVPPTDEIAHEDAEKGKPQPEPTATDLARGDSSLVPEPQEEATPPEKPIVVAECSPSMDTVDDAQETQQSCIPPIVPKFYGVYKSVDEGFEHLSQMHPTCNEDSSCSVSWPTRILLLEECGTPVVPSRLTYEQRHVPFEP